MGDQQKRDSGISTPENHKPTTPPKGDEKNQLNETGNIIQPQSQQYFTYNHQQTNLQQTPQNNFGNFCYFNPMVGNMYPMPAPNYLFVNSCMNCLNRNDENALCQRCKDCVTPISNQPEQETSPSNTNENTHLFHGGPPAQLKTMMHSLHLSDLSPKTTEFDLINIFNENGFNLLTIYIKRLLGQSQGTGWAHFDSKENAERAKAVMNYYILHGQQIRLTFPGDNKKYPKDANVHISNVPKDLPSGVIEQYFSLCGPVVTVSMKYGRNSLRDGQLHMGSGNIQFYHSESAQRAIREINNQLFRSDQKTVLRVEYFKPQSERVCTYFNRAKPPVTYRD